MNVTGLLPAVFYSVVERSVSFGQVTLGSDSCLF